MDTIYLRKIIIFVSFLRNIAQTKYMNIHAHTQTHTYVFGNFKAFFLLNKAVYKHGIIIPT